MGVVCVFVVSVHETHLNWLVCILVNIHVYPVLSTKKCDWQNFVLRKAVGRWQVTMIANTEIVSSNYELKLSWRGVVNLRHVFGGVVELFCILTQFLNDRVSGVEIVVLSGSQKFGRTTNDDDSSNPMDYHKLWEYFSNFVFLSCYFA